MNHGGTQELTHSNGTCIERGETLADQLRILPKSRKYKAIGECSFTDIRFLANISNL